LKPTNSRETCRSARLFGASARCARRQREQRFSRRLAFKPLIQHCERRRRQRGGKASTAVVHCIAAWCQRDQAGSITSPHIRPAEMSEVGLTCAADARPAPGVCGRHQRYTSAYTGRIHRPHVEDVLRWRGIRRASSPRLPAFRAMADEWLAEDYQRRRQRSRRWFSQSGPAGQPPPSRPSARIATQAKSSG